MSIWKQKLAGEPLEAADPREALLEAAAQLDAAIEDLALLAEATPNDAVQLGAIKARLAAMEQKHDILRLAGLLPYSPQATRTEADLRQIGDDAVDVFKKHGVSHEAAVDFLAALGVPVAGG